MLTSMTCAPFSTCWRATSTAAMKSSTRISFLNAAEPVTLVRSPMLTKVEEERGLVICSSRSPPACGRGWGEGLSKFGRRREDQALPWPLPQAGGGLGSHRNRPQDRKSGVSGTRVSVRVDLGGRRIIKQKTHTTIQ